MPFPRTGDTYGQCKIRFYRKSCKRRKTRPFTPKQLIRNDNIKLHIHIKSIWKQDTLSLALKASGHFIIPPIEVTEEPVRVLEHGSGITNLLQSRSLLIGVNHGAACRRNLLDLQGNRYRSLFR